MDRKMYEQTEDFLKATKMLKAFVQDVLDGEIDRLANLDFEVHIWLNTISLK